MRKLDVKRIDTTHSTSIEFRNNTTDVNGFDGMMYCMSSSFYTQFKGKKGKIM